MYFFYGSEENGVNSLLSILSLHVHFLPACHKVGGNILKWILEISFASFSH